MAPYAVRDIVEFLEEEAPLSRIGWSLARSLLSLKEYEMSDTYRFDDEEKEHLKAISDYFRTAIEGRRALEEWTDFLKGNGTSTQHLFTDTQPYEILSKALPKNRDFVTQASRYAFVLDSFAEGRWPSVKTAARVGNVLTAALGEVNRERSQLHSRGGRYDASL